MFQQFPACSNPGRYSPALSLVYGPRPLHIPALRRYPHHVGTRPALWSMYAPPWIPPDTPSPPVGLLSNVISVRQPSPDKNISAATSAATGLRNHSTVATAARRSLAWTSSTAMADPISISHGMLATGAAAPAKNARWVVSVAPGEGPASVVPRSTSCVNIPRREGENARPQLLRLRLRLRRASSSRLRHPSIHILWTRQQSQPSRLRPPS